MRIRTTAAFVLLFASPAWSAQISAVSRVDAVTVFPRGAEVSRISKVTLEKGVHTVILNDLPPDAIASSIRVEGLATGKLEIGSVDSRRLTVPSTDEALSASERRRLEDELDLLRDQRSVADAQLQSAATQRTLISNLSQLPTRPAPVQGAERTEDWASVLATIATGSAEAQRNEVEAQAKIRVLDRQIADVEGKLNALAPAAVERTEVKVHVEALAPLEADLVIRYQVKSASWTPLYDARLATGDKTTPPVLSLVRRAEIRQNTGEGWDNVALSLSTTRPNAGSGVPDLQPVTVDFEPPPPPPAPVAAAAPEAEMDDAMMKRSLRPMAATSGESMAAAPPAMEDVDVRSANVIAAPFQAVYAVAGRTGVANTGQSKRVQLVAEKIEPSLSIKTVPKDDAKAYLYAKLAMPQSTPLLPGPVSLFRDGTFVGQGRLPLLSPNETHELGFGVDDLVRVKHALVEEKRGETGLISTSRTDVRTYKLTVKNMHERAIAVMVIDQVPVSNNQDIKVELTGKTQPTTTNLEDKRGVLSWDLTLEPDQEQAIDFGYRVVWPAAKTVVYR